MLVIIGFIVVFGAVLGGYTLHGGEVHVLVQPTEFLIIGGAGLGTLLISSPISLLKEIIRQLINTITGKAYSKADYIELLSCLFELLKLGKTNLMGLEPHIENPETSDIFKRYPHIAHNHHAIHFICDTLRVQISSPMSPYDLDDLMEIDLAAMHAEEEKAPITVNRVSDAMPGLGIVAAVLGVVITMGKLTQGKDVIGHSVAAALVGTFLGILLSYGFIGPLAAKMEASIAEGGRYMIVIKSALLAFAKDINPKMCVEYARRTIPPEIRPDFKEIDDMTSNIGKKAA